MEKKNFVILGAGTAGTMMANKLAGRLETSEWKITVIDRDEKHYYQPGFLFIPFGTYKPEDVVKNKRDFLPKEAEFLIGEIEKIETEKNQVILKDEKKISYDILLISTGCDISLNETEGLKGELWQKDIFDFYTFDGASKLAEKFKTWEGGRLVLNVAEMPIKCPVAPLEFLFLADEFFTKKGIRDKVEIHYVTPLPGAFTKPKASKVLGNLLQEKGIKLTTEFDIGSVDNEKKQIVSYDDKRIDFDLLVMIPTNMGDKVAENSGLGDELNYIPTEKHTLQSKDHKNIFVAGDATNLPSSKAGAVAHFEADILIENILQFIRGEEMTHKFDGHANCFIESGFGKAFLIDFNYDTEPLPGKFPLPFVGPFDLLKESRVNHFGKHMFRWVYWNMLLLGTDLPVSSAMSMAGKEIDKSED